MIKNPITPAFKELRKLGYEAHQGVRINEARILSMLCDKLVFYYEHERKNLKENGTAFIKFIGDPRIIIEVLERNAIKTEWNGNNDSAIKITI
mgnify:FL=1|jgi:hypothetical protein